MLQRNVIVIFLSAVVSLTCYQKIARSRYAGLVADALDQVTRFYVEPVEGRDLFEGAMDGMMGRLDQYSSYITPKEYSQFQETLGQEFGGVGIVVELNPDTKRLTILSPLVGTPAYQAGVQAGDTILEIDGESTDGFSLEDAVRRMRGEPSTAVRLKIQHLGEEEPTEITVTRAVIHIETVVGDTRNADGSWNFTLESDPDIGYIRIATFGDQTAKELRGALLSLEGQVAGIILELRGNAGGLLTSGVDVCDMFIDEGMIVSTRGRHAGKWKEYFADAQNTLVDAEIPVVLLVDKYSASASEIVAACLQDYGRAVIVGQRTWGKGTVQNVIPFEAGTSALKLTTATYWRPSGQNIHRGKNAEEDDNWGVRPDDGYEVILTDEQFEQALRYRRQRDVVRTDNGNESEGDDGNEETTTDEPFVDPQLQRAVEAIREQLARQRRAA